MEMNIGPIIMEKRKEKQVTQQELANFIGVSKASVSKWETGQTYPDITLLPLLAAYFDITIDSLLTYEPQLDNHEIQRIYGMLKKSLETQPPEDVLAMIRSFVRRYYSCYPFILQMGMFLMNHADLLPGEENIQTYTKEAQELFVHVKTQAKDPELITQALKYEAYTSLTLNEFDQVLEILGDQVPALFPIESLIAAAQQQKGEEQQAVITLQSAIYQYTTVFLSFLGNYLQVVINQPEKFAETVSRGIQFTDIFNFKRMHPVALMNFQLSAIFGYAQMQNETAAFPLLNDFLELMRETDFPVELHGDDYFDQVDKWLERLEIGHQLPRDSMKIKETLINFVINNPAFANFSDQAQLQQIYTELRLLQKKERAKHE
ncbi:helix-turn-helix transcriptional regulator [Enterococcus hulanensis]|uniref:Helix-turn-helix transcriptional regulator n=1 Tax=Enterococcus hulanensis TaxID=2559929 RepID=A0ABU3EYA5_9ENTE|nr:MULTISPECIES: helix-turn-helix transcriptional regulator [Enterococcus]MBX8939005.1 helix-turn-helix transcriptional regulator [Enterococcus gilvus]MDT2599657.1 helix-turn-helix transcriptional regulator [Enterococcus hulanensis]MDT2609487.1 helix-turn-helix transcriptional regulator [Enterococcus hulanensis]MDT2616064.1 helix-turn-helix transcriptional regulator [Enterococcus hulanensis]MDT2627896.1 helix-turn-helix transcriptional regulator [Enterococcus hulanensis]